jgi:hypothetical protein
MRIDVSGIPNSKKQVLCVQRTEIASRELFEAWIERLYSAAEAVWPSEPEVAQKKPPKEKENEK